MSWFIPKPSWLSKNSSTEQETTTAQRDDKRNSITARESDVDKELEHDEMQPHKMQRNTDEQSLVIYGREQGSSSNSQLSCDNLDWLSSYDPAKYPKIVTLKEKIGRLFARRRDILTELEHAEFQPGKKRREEVHHWLTLVPRKKDEILSVIKDDEGSSSNSNLHGHIERFIKEVDELFQRGRFPNGLVVPDQESTRLPLLLGKELIGINFKQNAKKILEWLQNHEHSIIGVYGMGGVGKTTLLLHIHDQLLKDPDLYGQVYWVTVSQNCTVQKLQGDIAKVIGVERLGEDDERKRASILHNKLASMGPIILILDDMWERFLGEKVGIPLEGSSCKLIISTRRRDLCLKMGCKDFVIKAEILSDVEAWGLFVDKLGHYDKLEEEAKKLARSVAQECGCLPLAIATMASSMTGVVDINEWKNVLNELECRRGQDEMNENVLPILQVSYDRLKEERDKNCFLSCILYGEDVKIKRDTLIEMWINEGLFDEIESWEHQVTKGHSILNKLESWSLLESCLDYKKKRRVKMHDLVRDMAISITQKHPRFIAKAGEGLKEVPNEEQWSKDLVKVSLSDNFFIKEIPSGMAPMTPNLTVLMLNRTYGVDKIPESFFQHMKALRVLDLSETSIESVPESVSDLENLRALLFSNCWKLEYVPSVANLTKLRVLGLNYCHRLKAEPRGLERLKSLEVLGYCPWDISNMRDFSKLIESSWSSLTSYEFWIRDPALFTNIEDSVIYEDIGINCERVVTIMGWEYREEDSSWMLPNTVEYLGIEKSDFKGRSLEDVLPSLGLGLDEETNLGKIDLIKCRGMISIAKVGGELDSFSDLEKLKIGGCENLYYLRVNRCNQVEEIFQSNERASQSNPIILSLPNLEELYLHKLPKLKAILSNLYIDVPKLTSLYLSQLRKLKWVFPITEQFHLPNLKTLWMEDCKEVEEIFHSNDGDSQSNPIILSLPNLEKLHLYNLPKLKAILSNLYIDVPKLTSLELRQLRKLKWVFPITEQFHLPNLKTLAVLQCEKVEEIFHSNDGDSQSNPIILSLPNLVVLYLYKLPKLKAILSNLYIDVPKLTSLHLIKLPKLKLPITMQLHLPTLTSLWVQDCEMVEEIFQIYNPNPALPNLKRVTLGNLPKLKRVFPFTEKLHQLPNLKELRVFDCEEVEEIFQIYNPNLGLPNLSVLRLQNLPKLKWVFPFTFTEQLRQLPNLEKLMVEDCQESDEIFRKYHPNIFWVGDHGLILENLPKLKWVFPFTEHPLHLVLLKIKVLNCSMLESICRGLILFPSPSKDFHVENCSKLKVFRFEEGKVIVDSKSTIECILNNTQFWEKLQQDYPRKARLLSYFTKRRMELWQGLDDDNDDGGVDGDGAEGDGDGGGVDGDGAEGDGDGGGVDGDGAEGDGGGDGDGDGDGAEGDGGADGDGGVLVLDDDDRTTWGASLSLLPF